MATSGASSARRKRAKESFVSAAETIGRIEKGMALFAVTRGQWSMLDALLYCVDMLGAGAAVSIWTWTIAEYEVAQFERLLARRDLVAASLIIDMAADRKAPHLIRRWREAFGPDSVRVCRSHAKIARVWAGDMRLLLRGSMNLNFNPRFEQFDLTEGGADYDLVERIEAELPVLHAPYTFAEVAAASKLRRAFTDDVLALFGDLGNLNEIEATEI